VSNFDRSAAQQSAISVLTVKKGLLISVDIFNLNNDIEATSNHRGRAAWDSLRTVSQGLGSCSGLRVDVRNRRCPFGLLPTWSAERTFRIHRDCGVPANRLRARLPIRRHPRPVVTSRDTPQIVASSGATPAALLSALPQRQEGGSAAVSFGLSFAQVESKQSAVARPSAYLTPPWASRFSQKKQRKTLRSPGVCAVIAVAESCGIGSRLPPGTIG
jgi:hypothetical protein